MIESAGYNVVKDQWGQPVSGSVYPILLRLEQQETLIIGAGTSAIETLRLLLGNAPGAKITVIDEDIPAELIRLAGQVTNCKLLPKKFEAADLDGKDIVMVTTGDLLFHKQLRTLTSQRKILLFVEGSPALSDFYLGTMRAALQDNNKLSELKWKKIATYVVIGFALMLIGHFILSYVPFRKLADSSWDMIRSLDRKFPLLILAGFLAQMVDGATSMGYGVTSSIVLMSANVPPAAISSSIHTAEMFASGASGYSHYRFGNVNKKLFKALLVPGVIGAIIGAILLVKFGETHIRYVRPIMAAYTFILGIRIFSSAFRKVLTRKKFKRHGWLAGVGGFFDSFGGGGWGPIVTSTLITKGRTPRYVVGSVSLTEFFVTVASALTFFTLIGVEHWQVIIALIIGGLIAAPIAARLSGKLPRKTSFLLLGSVVIVWSLIILIKAL